MKLYLHSFRNKGIFFEAATQIFEDLYACKPRWARLETIWRGRGGIRSNVVVEGSQESYDGRHASVFGLTTTKTQAVVIANQAWVFGVLQNSLGRFGHLCAVENDLVWLRQASLYAVKASLRLCERGDIL